jgi:hypothetical protein
VLEQQALLLGVDEPRHVDVGREFVVRVQARDVGVDVVGAALARERDAVVTVGDEVQAARLVDLDGRHVALRERRPQRRQARARERAARVEVAPEVGAAVDRADDPLERHGAQAAVGLARDLQAPPDLVEGQQTHAAR